MKRFFCIVCNKVKRVRQIPANVETPHAPKVEDRRGACKWHTEASATLDFNRKNRVSA